MAKTILGSRSTYRMDTQPLWHHDEIKRILNDTSFINEEERIDALHDVFADFFAVQNNEMDEDIYTESDMESRYDEGFEEGHHAGRSEAEANMHNKYGEKLIAEYDRGYENGLEAGRKDAEHAFRKIISPTE